jgi:hypothetical protein
MSRLKRKTNDQKQDKNKVNIGCASLVQYIKNELQADAQLGWNTTLEWISDQAKLETFQRNNDIDDNNTSKQNNHVGDNNEGGNQNMSEEEDSGKRVDESSSIDDDEDKNQYKDDNNEANKEKITTSFWENNSDEENKWNEQGSTEGDINRDDKTQDERGKKYASDNVEHEDDSNDQKSGGTSEIRGDDDITGIGRKDKKKGKGLKKKRY